MAVVVIDTIKPKNQGTFPIVEAADVKITNDKRLDAALNDKANQSDLTALQTTVSGKASQADLTALSETVSGKASQSDLTALSNTVAGKQNSLSTAQLAACNSGITSQLVTQIGTNTTAIAGKASQADLTALSVEVADKADESDLTAATSSLQGQIDNIVSGATVDSEVINARVSSDGTSYPTLNARITGDIAATNATITQLESEITDTEQIETVTHPTTTYTFGYVTTTGNVQTGTTNYVYTEKLEVQSGEVITISDSSGSNKNLRYVCAYNNNTVSDSDGAENVSFFTVPSGINYVQISIYSDSTSASNKTINVVHTTTKHNVKGMSTVTAEITAINTSITQIEGELGKITDTEQYGTVIHPTTTYTFGYVTTTGFIQTGGTTDYVYTEKLEVESGDVITVTDSSSTSKLLRFVCAYNNNTVMTSDGADSVYSYTVPVGVNYVQISIPANSTDASNKTINIVRQATRLVNALYNNKDKLYGKKWCVIGDSFTYGGYTPMNKFTEGMYAGARKVYPYYIGNNTHINIVDFSASGRTLAFPEVPGTFTNSITCPTAACYYQNIPSDVDYITIYLGINDSHHAQGGGDGEDSTGYIPLGTVNDNSPYTFGGAWNVVLSWLITNRPNAHIGIIVSNGCDSDDYRTLTIAIAQKYGIPYIDLNGDQITPAMLRTTNPNIPYSVKQALFEKWSVDYPSNTHPTDAAHEFESTIIEDFLRRI